MGLLGTLAVNLTAKTEKFDKGMKRGRENLDKFKSRSQGASKALEGATKSIGRNRRRCGT